MDMTCKKCVASEQHESHEQAESQDLLIQSCRISMLVLGSLQNSPCAIRSMFVLWKCSCRCSSQKICGFLQVLPGGECWCGSKKKMSRWDKPLKVFQWEICKYAFMYINIQMLQNQLVRDTDKTGISFLLWGGYREKAPSTLSLQKYLSKKVCKSCNLKDTIMFYSFLILHSDTQKFNLNSLVALPSGCAWGLLTLKYG